MALSPGKHFYLNAVCLFVFIISIGLVESLDRSQKSFLRDSLFAKAKEELSIVRSELEAAIVSDIYVVNGLSSLVASHAEYEFSGWDLIASSVIRKSRHVQWLGLAPDDIIQYVYPRDGNESVLGLDYRTVPSQWRTVQKAKELQEVVIAGPLNLVQGGLALIARVPIFSDPLYKSRYWGVCSVVIDLESLFIDAGVQTLEFRYSIAIRGIDSSGVNGEVFYGQQSTFDDAFAIESVNFPYGSWVIAASTNKDLLASQPWYQVHAVRLLGYPMILVLLVAFYMTLQLYSEASKRSLQDDLTLLPNRRYFMYTLQEHFDAVRKRNQQDKFAILNIDLDKFKSINDTYGHAAGDKVLIATAERLKTVLRASDVVARIGGDEFLVLLPRIASSADIDVINIELQKSICHTPVIYEQHLINLQVSVGYAIYDEKFSDVEQMLKLADSRMYAEKRRQMQRTITN
ncbi:diguanylate cyclase [Vibrio galatheae]|uniref:Diguanylate cyclase n=1 Tax=Vibrio galatheae TaxID=579748 RepID=A0A0F4NLG6_9VIBR|nr:diguanylate cyclase [Vibrio galatheae]KJY82901.1 diguanylate cyclase [Vibrio galatheae]